MSKTKNKRRKNSRKAGRDAAREISDVHKAYRANVKCLKERRLAETASGVATALMRVHGPKQLVMDAFERDRDKTGSFRQDPLFRNVRHNTAYQEKASEKLQALLHRVADKASKLITPHYVGALYWVSQLDWVRPLEDWKPKGKGSDSLFRSIVSHLLAKFRMPNLLWNALFVEHSYDGTPCDLYKLVGFVAGGGSLYKAVQDGLLNVPLTRKMCHELMVTPAESFVSAVRRILVRACEGDLRLHQAWMATDVGSAFHSREDEEFWLTVLRWFTANPMLDRTQLAPLMDFIGSCRRDAARRPQGEGAEPFTMKGRSALAMLRNMAAWHGDLAKERSIKGIVFKPSGFENLTHARRVRLKSGGLVEQTWAITEIETSKDLSSEGRALKHCVYSYAWRIEDNKVSIWSMRKDGERCLTIEVINGSRRVVQARGKHNRQPEGFEGKMLIKWAGENGLEIASNRMF